MARYQQGARVLWTGGSGVVAGVVGSTPATEAPGAPAHDPLYRLIRDDGETLLRFESELSEKGETARD